MKHSGHAVTGCLGAVMCNSAIMKTLQTNIYKMKCSYFAIGI